jgi:hypothetical protein
VSNSPQSSCFEFSRHAVTSLGEQLQLREVTHPTTGCDYLTLRSPRGAIGFFRVWLGEPGHFVQKLTHMHVGIEHIGLDINLFWVITSRDSLVPHFTCHFNLSPGAQYSYHVDLLPKVDGVYYPDYIDHYFRPLSASFHRAKELTGQWTRPSEHQYLMSGWGLYGETTDPEIMVGMQPIILDYVDHYCRLDERDMTDQGITREHLHRRHDLHLQKIFCRASDPDSYQIMDRVLGTEQTDLINEVHVKDGLPA